MLFNETFYENNQPPTALIHIRDAGELHADKKYVIERSHSKTNVIGYIQSGTLHVDIYSNTYQVYTGTCFILPHEKHYKMYSDIHSPCRMLWLNVRGSLCECLIDTLFDPDTMIISSFNMENHFNKLVGLMSEYTDTSYEIMQSFSSLLIDLAKTQRLPDEYVQPHSTTLRDSMDQYILNRVQFDFSVKDMSKHFHLSIGQLNRVFSKDFGITPYQYYQRVRIDLAKSLLCNTDFSIEDISDRLGFSNRNNFSACFKTFTSHSPAKYRKHIE